MQKIPFAYRDQNKAAVHIEQMWNLGAREQKGVFTVTFFFPLNFIQQKIMPMHTLKNPHILFLKMSDPLISRKQQF